MIKQRVEDALCPRCGITRVRGRDDCPGCGIVYVKYEAAVRKRQLEEKPAPPTRHGPDWNRLPVYAGLALLAGALWQSGAIWRHVRAAIDEATRINSTATGGAPLAVLAFSCRSAEGATMVASGEVQNRTQRTLTLQADVAWLDHADGIDTTRHAETIIVPDALPPLAIGRFRIALQRYPNRVADCRVAGLAEQGGAPIAFDGPRG